MPTPGAPFKIAAVQASPVFLDREATVEKLSFNDDHLHRDPDYSWEAYLQS